jgi:menaquinone-dependent protoporphyrinogen oxidase
MSRILIVYASSYGQTRAVAHAVAARLRECGHVVELGDAACGVARLPPPDDYDAVVLGSRVEYGRHARSIAAYVGRHLDRLRAMPTGFFSVSMSASALGPARDAYLARFIADSGWRPGRAVSIAGALHYTEYGWLTRLVMKRIAKSHGQPTDTRRDHVFTDWGAVARFADELAGDLRDRATPVPTAPTATPA